PALLLIDAQHLDEQPGGQVARPAEELADVRRLARLPLPFQLLRRVLRGARGPDLGFVAVVSHRPPRPGAVRGPRARRRARTACGALPGCRPPGPRSPARGGPAPSAQRPAAPRR